MPRFDFVPHDKEVIDGQLVKKRPDPYVKIEQLNLRIRELERKIDQGENAELTIASVESRRRLGELEREVVDLKAKADAAIEQLDLAVAERDAALATISELRMRAELATQLPAVTSTLEDVAAARREVDEVAGELIDARHEVQEQKGEILDLRGKIGELQKELRETQAKAKADARAAEIKIDQLQTGQQDFHAKIEELKREKKRAPK